MRGCLAGGLFGAWVFGAEGVAPRRYYYHLLLGEVGEEVCEVWVDVYLLGGT